MNNISVYEGIISLFIIMLIGIYARKKDIITDEINKGITEILLKISLPLLIISSFNITYSDELKINVMKCFYYSIITFIISVIISKILLKRIKSENRYILQFSNVFSNCGFIGFPIIEGIYGKEGLIYASVFNMIFTIFVWTYGVSLFTGGVKKENIKKVISNPSIIAVCIGILIMIFKINLPSIILNPIETVGSITSALSMLIVGAIIANINIKDYIKDLSLYYGVVIKLLIIPILIYFVLLLLPGPLKVIKVMVLLSSMPTAAMAPIFAESFEKDRGYASVLLFLTTLFSVISFPIMIVIIK